MSLLDERIDHDKTSTARHTDWCIRFTGGEFQGVFVQTPREYLLESPQNCL